MSSGDSLRLRVQLTKEGTARYLSHTEFQRNLMLAARRAGLPLAYSEGHRPKMKISLSPPLPIGVTSEGELVDFALDSYLSGAEAAKRLDEVLPPGISVVNARLLGAGSRPVGKLIDTAVYVAFLPGAAGGEGEWKNAVEQFLRSDTVEFERVQPRRTRKVDLWPGVHSLEASADEGGGVAVRMVLDDADAGHGLRQAAGRDAAPPRECGPAACRAGAGRRRQLARGKGSPDGSVYAARGAAALADGRGTEEAGCMTASWGCSSL